MLSSIEFIRQSLDTHLFFARIMKEHSFFLQIGFTPKNTSFIQRADTLRRAFDKLLKDVVLLSGGVASPAVLRSGEVVTPYTLNAERVTSSFTGIEIPTALTQAETGLGSDGSMTVTPALEQKVAMINQRAMNLLAGLIQLKVSILSNVLSCNMFTMNYPLLIEHILREARVYLRTVQRIQNRETVNLEREAYEQEVFWNRIMAEHAKFIRGLLDPSENALFDAANEFGNEFDRLTAEAKAAMDMAMPLTVVTDESLKATQRIRDFKAQGTQGLLECQVRSIIIPLLGDHTLREANHYLRLLEEFEHGRMS